MVYLYRNIGRHSRTLFTFGFGRSDIALYCQVGHTAEHCSEILICVLSWLGLNRHKRTTTTYVSIYMGVTLGTNTWNAIIRH